MKPDYVLSFSSALEVDINNEHFLPLDEDFLWDATLQYLESTDEISASDLRNFRKHVCVGRAQQLRKHSKGYQCNILYFQTSNGFSLLCSSIYSLANQVQASAKLLLQVIKVDEIHILMEVFMDYTAFLLFLLTRSP